MAEIQMLICLLKVNIGGRLKILFRKLLFISIAANFQDS